jgi:hypothetical protein
MRSTDYDDTISAIEQEYSRGEYSDLDADPEAEARQRSRDEQAAIDKDRQRARGSRRLAEVAFTPGGLPALRNDGRTVADLELEGYAQATGHRAEPWTTPLGPMAIPCVRDDPKKFKPIIDAWERDPTGYLAELKRRGLVR